MVHRTCGISRGVTAGEVLSPKATLDPATPPRTRVDPTVRVRPLGPILDRRR